MTAKEARELLKKMNELPAQESFNFVKENFDEITKAEGYLEALEGPEVKELIEGLEIINGQKGCPKNDCSCHGFIRISEKYLSKFKKATGE